jgi:two-component system, NtrC family, sensor kinase
MTAPPDDTTTDTDAIVVALRAERDAALAREAALAKELAARTAELGQRNSDYGERIDHQAATIDVLKAMAASPGDPQPVFDLIARRARNLCGGAHVGLFEFDGTLIHIRAWSGIYHAGIEFRYPKLPTRDTISSRAILERRIFHIRDADTDLDLLDAIREAGSRSILSVPLVRDGAAVGAISLNALERGGFSDGQVELLKTFAEQAVIAISSAETYCALQTRTRDLQETLEYQTATSDVLRVISRSTFDL